MGFGEAVATCFSKYFKFSGRARRPEYWYFILFYVIAVIVFAIVDALLFGGASVSGTVFWLATLFPAYAVTWRRLHDIGRPGYWALMPIFIVIAVLVIVMAVLAANGFTFDWFERFSANPDLAMSELEPYFGTLGILAVVGYLASFVIMILVFVWTIFPTQKGANRFGPEPTSELDVEGVFE